MKRLLFLFLLLPLIAQAATWPAASAQRQAVVDAINLASNGDTVTIPAGSAPWSTTIVIPTGKYLSIIGAGRGGDGTTASGGTVITNTSGTTLIRFSGTGANFCRVSGIRFLNPDNTIDCTIGIKGPMTKWRVDNCYFDRGDSAVGANMWMDGNFGVGAISPVYGVIDHCIFRNMKRAHYSMDTRNNDGGALAYAEGIIEPGTDKMVYVEDCYFFWDTSFHDPFTQGSLHGGWAGKCCFRYNVSEGFDFYVDAHGDTPDEGTMYYEVYGNTFIENIQFSQQGVMFFLRGGTHIVYDNEFYANDGVVNQNLINMTWYWPDDVHVIGWGNRDSYFWNNRKFGTGLPTAGVVENPGVQESNQTPASPTWSRDRIRAGIEYHNAPPQSGQTYFPYTAFIHPHPLVTDSGGGGDTVAPVRSTSTITNSGTQLVHTYNEHVQSGGTTTGFTITGLTGGAATATFDSIDSNQVILNLSRTVGSSETGGLASYVQPVNGIEDLAGNDAASFSNVNVDNTSTQNQVATPTFSPVEGPYYGTQNVTISSATGGTTIYYTVNGATPTTGSTLYSTPVAVAAGTTLKALAIKAAMTDSAIGTSVYEVDSWASSGAVFKSVSVPQKTTTFTCAFDVTPSVGNAYCVVMIGPDIFDESDDMTISFWFTDTGIVRARNGAVYDAVQVIPYSAATTYRIVVTGDIATDTYSAMVGSSTLATNYAFRVPVSEIDHIGFYTQNGTTVVNNVSFDQPTNPPVPGSVTNLIIGL